MPNDDNLINIVGKPAQKFGKRKRNRTRNRQAYMHIENLLQQQTDNARNLVKPVPAAGTAAASQGNPPGVVTSDKTQTPIQQNTPGGAGAKQTVNTKSQPANTAVAGTSQIKKPAANVAKPPSVSQKEQAPSWLTPEKLLHWKQFQENLQWNFENQPKNQDTNKQTISFSINSKGKNNNTNLKAKKQANNNKPAVTASNTENKDTKSEAKMTEIKWELNQVDDLDDSIEESPSKSQTTQVIKGFASEIKLTVKDQRKLIATKESSPQNVPVTPPTPVVVKQQERAGRPKHDYYNRADSRQQQPLPPGPMPLPRNKPAGVPMSFLANQNSFYGAIQPQENISVIIPAQEPVRSQQPFPPPHAPAQPNYMNNSNSTAAAEPTQQYSPTEIYDPVDADTGEAEGSPEPAGQKRLSAFHRLGPVAAPKKPKLTINLLCNKDVREVVDDTKKEDEYTPVHLREDILKSTDEVVMKYLPWWPWKKNVPIKKSVSARFSKSAMLLEQEQMEEAYEKDGVFFQLSVRSYPPRWRKQQLLDLLLASVRGKSFIPCFIEFTPKLCRFLVIRSKSALTAIHKLGFYIRHEDSEVAITISQTDVSLNQIDFIPRLILRKILSKRYDSESKLDLEAFTLEEDISHFIYFPLHRPANQAELTQLQSAVAWEHLTELSLARNRLKSIDAFSLDTRCPRLRRLDLSHNCLERATCLLRCRELPLKSLRLEGNPLCHDYTDPDHYIRVVKMMFPALTEIDGLPIKLKGDLPKPRRHYCPEDSKGLVEQFLEVFFPLMDSDDRDQVDDLYGENAIMTITYRDSARSYLFRHFRNLTLRARGSGGAGGEVVRGLASLRRLLAKWPRVRHDAASLAADLLCRCDLSAILRVSGILKLSSDSLADEEPLLAFTRTFVLVSRNGVDYKIQNEMVHWDEPSPQCADVAFQINTVRPKQLTLKFESPPDKETKEHLVNIFAKITDLDKETSERCLELKEWNMKTALEHFMKLVKLDCLDSLKKTDTNQD